MTTIHAEIIAIGSELTTGAKLDTNSQWLSQELAALGIPVGFHSTVADDLPAMLDLLRAAVNRSDIVLITGGLGPTLDDLTRQALADLVQAELVLHQPSLEFIQSLFARRNREMPERNVIQAMFPTGSEPLANPRGTAPGIWMDVPRPGQPTSCKIAAMPGVPSEMKWMFHHEVVPRLPDGGQVIQRARIHCFGLGESAAEELLGDLTARGQDPDVGITAHEATITLRITAHGASEQVCCGKIAVVNQLIRDRLGDYIFGQEDEELEHVVVRLLNDRDQTLAAAEAGTGGLLSHRLTDVPGAEQCFLGGVVAPSHAARLDLLGMDAAILKTTDPGGPELAEQMARSCQMRFRADFALAIAECPRNESDPTLSLEQHASVALAGSNFVEVSQQTLTGDPAIAKSRIVKAALNLLRLHLMR